MPDRWRPETPRIAPLAPEDQDRDTSALLARISLPGNPPAANVFATLARNRPLLRKWLSASNALISGSLPARARELAILRTAWRCASVYEWGQHWVIARHYRMTDDEVRRVMAGPDAPGWDGTDSSVLRAADELHDDACIGEETWRALAGVFDDVQLIELVMVVGLYHQIAFALNSLGVEREDGVPGFGD